MSDSTPPNSTHTDALQPDPAIAAANLKLLALRDGQLAQKVKQLLDDGLAKQAATWFESPQGLACTIEIKTGGDDDADQSSEAKQNTQAKPVAKPVALCSKYRPVDEADRHLKEFDPVNSQTLVLAGLGLGYTAIQAAKAMQGKGVLAVHEPSLERFALAIAGVDQRPWLVHPTLILMVGEADAAVMARQFENVATPVTQGTKLITHPVIRRLDEQAMKDFGNLVAKTVAYCRTLIATTLVNASRTYGNLCQNMADYAAGHNIKPLQNIAKGRLAVCVSAGPSLVKNVHLLQDPKVRANVVVIAVQTALKPLLDRGVTPDFVTALDYSAICKRFYESLPPLPHTTLVAEPKAHPVILESYPGPTRVLQNEFADKLLEEIKPDIPNIPAGATVAHLSFYLAQYLGCDPICFIGQDLGFSNGLYYCPGTAAHDVWSSELNPFSTIENYEFERIVRHKGHLSRHTDQNGQPCFSDEQMVTYLKQFERDFIDADQHILDCTEGGLPKAHTTPMPLAEAIAQYASQPDDQPIPAIPHPTPGLETDRVKQAIQAVEHRRQQVNRLRQTTEESKPILRRMYEAVDNPGRYDKLHQQLDRNRKRAQGELKPALELVTQLNSVGAFRRLRHDHKIQHLKTNKIEKAKAQIERDQDNLTWLSQACDEALHMLDQGLANMKKRLTTNPAISTDSTSSQSNQTASTSGSITIHTVLDGSPSQTPSTSGAAR